MEMPRSASGTCSATRLCGGIQIAMTREHGETDSVSGAVRDGDTRGERAWFDCAGLAGKWRPGRGRSDHVAPITLAETPEPRRGCSAAVSLAARPPGTDPDRLRSGRCPAHPLLPSSNR